MAAATASSNQRRQQRDQTRQQILKAAAQVFALRGFAAASMAEIAEHAQLKKALIQYHFETKDNLWKAAVEQLWQQRDRLMPRYLGGGNSHAAVQDSTHNSDGCRSDGCHSEYELRSIFSALVRFSHHHPEWMALVFREASNPGPRLNWLIDNFLRSDLARGTEFIEQAQRDRLLPAGCPLQLLHLISGALSYNLLVAPMTRRATGVNLASEQSISEQVELLLGLLEAAAQ